jgi:hypothetical protein
MHKISFYRYKKKQLTKTFSRQIENEVPPAIKIISLKNGECFKATIGPS